MRACVDNCEINKKYGFKLPCPAKSHTATETFCEGVAPRKSQFNISIPSVKGTHFSEHFHLPVEMLFRLSACFFHRLTRH